LNTTFEILYAVSNGQNPAKGCNLSTGLLYLVLGHFHRNMGGGWSSIELCAAEVEMLSGGDAFSELSGIQGGGWLHLSRVDL
jgi:hypothetical protein